MDGWIDSTYYTSPNVPPHAPQPPRGPPWARASFNAGFLGFPPQSHSIQPIYYPNYRSPIISFFLRLPPGIIQLKLLWGPVLFFYFHFLSPPPTMEGGGDGRGEGVT